MQTVRSVVRTLGALAAVFLAVAGPLIAAVPAARASAGAAQQRPLTVAITGMTPSYATAKSTVIVTGTLTNRTGAPLPGLALQAWTSTGSFQFPSQMTDFTDGITTAASPQLQPAGAQYSVPDSVPNGATVRWSVSFPAAGLYYGFGVYPVEVQAQSIDTAATATARTFLPFWPGGNPAAGPVPLRVAWVWPLIDTPQQGACPQTLATSGLAGSVASGGRLSTLLDAGANWAQKDDLTWDIDPALLSDVSVMTKTYFTQGLADCTDRLSNQPSKAASAWLSELKASTAGAPAFLAPYGNVDVAALSHAGLDGDIKSAYQVGETVAGQVLPDTFGKTGGGNGQVLKAAWPTNGRADAEVLTNLAHDGGIGTVVLSSNEVSSSVAGGEDALARTISGVGTSMSVLSANARITSLLGTASASAPPSSQFALTQDFLAQTAMIAAESPGASRSLVVAPPPNWDPSPAEANTLLSDTRAPWLHPATLSDLSTAAASLSSVTQVKAKQVSGSELSDAYMDNISAVSADLSLFEDLLYHPSTRTLTLLNGALATAESSAWRGPGSAGGWRAYGQLAQYLKDSEHKVQLIASKKILLTGQSGETAVSVLNGLGQPIRVKVTASMPAGSALQVGPFNALVTVQAGGTHTITMPVQSATLGTTTLQLQLVAPNGTPLGWDEAKQPLSVEVTRFGRSLLIVIGGALGILVLTSAYRLRRKRLAGTTKDDDPEGTSG